MKLAIQLFLALLVLVACESAHAQSCTVVAPSLAFGAYNPMATSPTNSTSSLTVRCQSNADASISYQMLLETGGSGTFSPRKMSNLAYQLYSNASRTIIWGDGTAGTSAVSDSYHLEANAPVTRTYTIYGQIPALQRVSPNSYSDTVTIIVMY
jgi:spore coat protein U-like protein